MVRHTNFRRLSQLSVRSLLTCAVAGVGIFAQQAMANDVIKAGNANNLDLGSSWLGGVVPGASDVAVFDFNMGSFSSFTLGDNLQSWQGIRLSNPNVGVTILAGNTLNLGTGGIDVTGSNFALTLNNNLVLTNAGETWSVGSGGLNVGGTTNVGGGSLNLSGFGNMVITGAMSNGTVAIANVNASLSGADNLALITLSNSYTALTGTRTVGTMTLSSGTLTADTGAAVGGGLLNLGGGLFRNVGAGTMTLTNAINVTSGTATFDVGQGLVMTGSLTLTSNPTQINFGSGNSTLTGNFKSANRLQKAGSGNLTLLGNNSAGNFFLVEGSLTVGPGGIYLVSATGNGSSISLGSGTANTYLSVNGGTLSFTVNQPPRISTVANTSNFVRVSNNGLFNVGSAQQIAVGNANNAYAALTIDTGSRLTTNGGIAVANTSSNSWGVLNMVSGSATNSGTIFIAGGVAGSTAVGIMNVSGGTFNSTAGSFQVGQFGYGVLNLSGAAQINGGTSSIFVGINTGSTGIVNLNGGTLTIGRLQGSLTASSTVNFNGGTLVKSGALDPLISGFGSAVVWGGGLTIVSAATASIPQALVAPTGNGVASVTLDNTSLGGFKDTPVVRITGDGTGASAVANIDSNGVLTGITVTSRGTGYTNATVSIFYQGVTVPVATAVLGSNSALPAGGLTVTGGGTVALRALNTYAGTTAVNGAVALVDFQNSTSNSANLINALSPLALNSGTITVNNATISSVGRAQTVNGLTVGVGTQAASSVVVLNTSTVSDSAVVLNLGALSHVAGGLVDFNSTFGTQSLTNGITSTTANSGGIIGGWATWLVNGTAPTWAVSGGNGTSAGNITGLADGSFSTTLGAGGNVNLTAGSYTAAGAINSLRMNDSTGGYTIDATAGLVVNTGGLMFLAGTNSGVISNGAISTAASDLIIYQNNTASSLTINSALTLGGASLVKTGNGTLLLNGTASYTGKTYVYGGTLGISDVSELGVNPGALVANQLNLAGGLKLFNSMSLGNRGVTLLANSVIDTNGNNATIGALTSGTGVFGLTKAGSGVLTLSGDNTIQGNLTVNGGSVNMLGANLLPSGVVTVGASANVPAVLTLNGGTLTPRGGTSPSIIVGSGTSGTGVLVMNSGIANFVQELYFGFGPNATDAAESSYGALLMNGGTLIHSSYFGLARGQAVNSAGTALLQMNGGTILGNASNNFQIGAFQGTAGKLHAVAVLMGGTIGENNSFVVGDSIPGIANLLGTNVTAGTFTIGNGGAGVANLNAGTVTSQVTFGTSGGVLNFNGGTLQARTGITSLIANSAAGRAYVWGGGAIFDSNGTSSTVAQALLAPDVNGVGGFNTIVNASASVTAATVTLTGGLPAGFNTASATAVATIVNGSISGVQITNPGYGYTSAPTVTISSDGGTASASASLATLQGVSLNLSAANFTGGSGYVAPPIVAILPATDGTQIGGGAGASAYATVDASGNLTGIVLTNPGVGYNTITNGTTTFFPTISILGGGGTGATIGQLSLFNLLSGGGVTKNGPGTLTFSSSASTFTGPTSINAGAVVVSGTFNGAGAVTVASAASLNVTGKVTGAITVNGGSLSVSGVAAGAVVLNGGLFNLNNNGQIGSTVQVHSAGILNVTGSATVTGALSVDGGGLLDMSGAAIGTLSLPGGLTLNNATAPVALKFDLFSASDTIVASSLTVNGTNSSPITLNIGIPIPNLVYTLATFSTSTNVIGMFNLTSNSTKSGFVTLDLQTTANAITVTTHGKNQPADAYWTGQYGQAWTSLDGSGTNSNFNDSPTIDSNANQYPGTASNVIFVSTVIPAMQNLSNVLAADFSVKSVQVKSGTGAITISNATAGVQTLTVGTGGLVNEAGAGGLTINSNVALGTTQTWSSLDAATLITVNGNISGGTGNMLSVFGVVQLAGTNTYSGGTFIGNGTLTAGSNAALGAATGTLTLGANGKLQLNGRAITIGGLVNLDSSAIIENSGAGAGTLTLNTVAGANTAYSGILQDGTSSTMSLRVTGNGSLTLGSFNTITGTFAVGTGTAILNANGALTVTNNLVTVGDVANTMGTIIVNGGTLNANRGATSPAIIIGSGANTKGAVVLNSGVVAFTNESYFAYGPNATDAAASSYGALIVNGGTLTHSSFLGLSRGLAVNSGGVAILQMTGGLIDGSASGNPLQVGAYQGTASVLHAVAVLQGGNIVEQQMAVGDFVNGVANLLGTNVTANTTAMGKDGGSGILNLNAGTLTTAVTWNGSSVINLNGGTLRALANNGTLIANSTAGSVYVQAGGAIIDTSTVNTTIAQALLTPASQKVNSITITNGGTGFTAAPTLALSGGGGTGATATAVVNTTNGSIGTITITNPGVGYTSAPTITVTGPAGSGGFVLAPVMGATQGLGTIAVSAGGTGYLNAPPVLEVTGGGGTGATAIANVSANGVITSITVTNPGIGYTAQPTITIRGGGGTGLTIGARTLVDIVGGGLTVNGSGTVTLSNTVNTYSGSTLLNSGKMNITGAVTGSPTWNINNTSILNVTGTLNAATAINIGSAASMTSTGVIATGTLSVGGLVTAGGTLSATTVINVLSGGTFNARGAVSAPAVNVSGGGVLSGAGIVTGPVTLAAGANDAARGTINTIDGAAGTLTLAGPLTVGGSGLTSNIKMDITDLVNLGSNPLVTNAGGATIFLNGSGMEQVGNVYTLMTYNNTASPALALVSGFMGFDAVSLSLSNSSASVTILTVPAAPATAYFSNNRGDGVWNTVVSGSQSNWNTDASSNIGVSQLPGANTNVYLVTSNPSVSNLNMTLGQDFQIQSLHALGSTGAATLSGNNTLTVGSGGITLDSGQGGLTLNTKLILSSSQTWTNDTFNPLTINGAVSSTGDVSLVKNGIGQLMLNGAGSFGGSITLNGGTITVGSNTALGNGSTSFLFGPGSGTHLQLSGHNVQVGTLSGDFSAVIENGDAAAANLTAGGSVDSTFDGQIQDSGTGATGLIKSGSGKLTLTNNLFYSGPTTVRQGQLFLSGQINPGTTAQVTVGNTAGLDALFNVVNGAVNASKTTAPSLQIGSAAGSSGVMRISGGTVTTASELHIGGNGVGAGNAAYAALDMSSGSLSVGSWLVVGFNNDRSVFNMSGGVLTVNSNSISIAGGAAASPNAFGVMNVSGNSSIVSNSTASVSLYVGESGVGVLNVSGNANIVLGGSLTFARLTAGSGVVNLLGGNVTASAVTMASAGSSVFNFNGGTLAPAGNAATAFMTGLSGAYVWSGSANINDNGMSITIGQNLLAPTGNGVASITVTGATGFIDTPVVLIAGGGGTGATAVANVDTAGNLTGITITNPGVGYTSAPTVTVTGGGLAAGNGTAGVTVGAVTLASNAGLGGGLNKYGTGVLTLSGTSTYAGPTTVNGGVLSISANANLGAAGPLNLNGGTLQTTATFTMDNAGANKRNIVVSGGVTFDGVSSSNTLTVTGNISGAGSVTLTNGKLNINGTCSVPILVTGFNGTRLGGTGVVSAPVTVDNNNEISLLNGNVGTLTLSGGLISTGYQNGLRFDLGGVSVGAVDKVNLGSSTLTLGSSNVTVYLNNLGVNPGTYTLMSYGSLVTSGGSLTLDFNSLTLGASTATISQTATALLLTVAGAAIPSTAYWSGSQSSGFWNTVNSGSLTNFNTSVSGGIDTHQTPGAITNVFFATTSPAQTGPLVTSLGADMAVRSITVTSAMTSSVSISGNTLSVGDGGLSMQAGAGALTVSSNVALLSDQTWTNANTASTLTVSGVISGIQNLNFSGKVSIGGGSPNIFIGNVGINNNSRLTLGGAGALGDVTNQVNFAAASSATLDLGSFATTIGGINGDSSATVTGSGVLTIAAVGTPNFSGTLNGSMALTIAAGTGTQTLSGVNTQTGATNINGAVKLGNNSALSPNSALTLSATGKMDMNGFNGTVPAYTGAAGSVITNNSAGTTSLLTIPVGTGVTATFNTTLQDGAGAVGLVMTGLGRLDFATTDGNYSGGVALLGGGTLSAADTAFAGQVKNSFGTGTITLTNGYLRGVPGFANNSPYVIPNAILVNGTAGSVHINTTAVAAATFSGDLSGSGWMGHWGGGGVLTFSGNNANFHGTLAEETANGAIGDMVFSGPNAYPAADFTLITDQNTVTFNATANATVGIGALSSTQAAGTVLVNTGSNVASTTLSVGAANVDCTFLGAIQANSNNTMTLIKVGTGSLVLAGANGYGSTTVSAGTLQIGNGGTTGNISSGPILDNANLAFNRSDNVTLANVISGSGTLTQAGSATLILTGANSYGATNIVTGVIEVDGVGSLGSGNVANAGVLAFNGTGTTVPGNISGAGAINQLAGTTILTGTNTMSGPLAITGGNLQVGNGGATGSLGTSNVANATSLTLNRTGTLAVSGTITGNGTLIKSGSGTATLANYKGTGPVNVSAGTLALGTTAGTRHTSAVLVQASAATVASGATLDLANHDLLIHGGNAATIESLIGSSYFFGLWNKPGITSSSAQSNPITTLGIMSGADYNTYSPTPGVFDGVPVANTDIVVKYTYSGDINLDGLVNDDDFGLFSGAYFFTGVGNYALGDLNFDGLVNDDDFGVFSGNYFFTPPSPLGGLGDTSLASASASGGSSAPVPEPASLVLLGMGATALLSRRKNRRRI